MSWTGGVTWSAGNYLTETKLDTMVLDQEWVFGLQQRMLLGGFCYSVPVDDSNPSTIRCRAKLGSTWSSYYGGIGDFIIEDYDATSWNDATTHILATEYDLQCPIGTTQYSDTSAIVLPNENNTTNPSPISFAPA